MEHFGNSIRSGLLGALDWFGEQEPEVQHFSINMGGPSPQVTYRSGNSYQINHGDFQPPQALPGAFAPAMPNAVWNPGVGMASPAANPAIWNTAQQGAYPILPVAAQEEQNTYKGHTYRVGRRALGIWGGELFFNESGDDDGAGKDHNRRAEHQHFIGSNGKNFGLAPNGIFEETPEELSKYTFDIPNIEGRRMKGVYIDAAREKIERRWQEIEQMLEDKNSRTPIFKGMVKRRRPRYNLFDYNCQHLVDDVMAEAEKEAKRKGESLYLD